MSQDWHRIQQDIMKNINQDMENVRKDIKAISNDMTNINLALHQKGDMAAFDSYFKETKMFKTVAKREPEVSVTLVKKGSGKKAPAKKRQAVQKKEIDPQTHISEDYRGGLSEAYVKLKEENQKLTERAIAAELQLALVLAPQPSRWERMKLAWKEFSWKEYLEDVKHETGQMIVRAVEKTIQSYIRFTQSL